MATPEYDERARRLEVLRTEMLPLHLPDEALEALDNGITQATRDVLDDMTQSEIAAGMDTHCAFAFRARHAGNVWASLAAMATVVARCLGQHSLARTQEKQAKQDGAQQN